MSDDTIRDQIKDRVKSMSEQNEKPTLTPQNNDFLARLGLDTDPFPAEADSSFYYENPDLMQRLDMIQHLIGYSNQMIFVTGEQGIGKTSMLERLEYYAPDHWRICRIQADHMLNTPALLRQLAAGFDLDISSNEDDMFQVYSEALQGHIETLERAMLTPVVLIDDAHELPIDAFTMLFGFMQQEGGQSRMKMALFCEPQVIRMLDSPQLKVLSQNLTHQLEIPAFDEQQTREFLEQRLNHAGLTGELPFLPETIQKIYQDSRGVAENIHTLALQALLDEESPIDDIDDTPTTLPVIDEVLEFEEEVEEVFPATSTARAKREKEMPIGGKFQSWQIGAVAIVLAVLAGILWLTSQFGENAEPTIAKEIPLDITPVIPEVIEPVINQSAQQDANLLEEPVTLADPEQVTIPAEQIAAEVVPTETTTADPLDDFLQSIEEREPEVNRQPDDVAMVTIDENGQAQVVESSPIDELPIAVTEPVITTETATVKPEVTPIAAATVKSPVAKPVSNQQAVLSGIKGESWLRSQNDSGVLLQLLGTHDLVALQKIVNENPMGANVAWFTTVHDGEAWYVVVKGPYKDRATAVGSIASLPANLRKRRPWPRSVAGVKQAMDEAQ